MKKYLAFAALLFPLSSQAASQTYKVEGMHCGGCVKSIKSKVCKMDGIENCEVSIGKLVISTKEGVTLTPDQIQTEMSKAGEYKLIIPTQTK